MPPSFHRSLNFLSLLLACFFLGVFFMPTASAKTLIVYFTLTHNTEKAAQAVQAEVGGDLMQIEAQEPYPPVYRQQTEIAKDELNRGYLRPIKPLTKNLKDYDVIFVGSPVWWGTMATPIHTFLTNPELKGKIVIPFVTHGGGGADQAFSDTQKRCAGCTVYTDGWSGYGSTTAGIGPWAKKQLAKAQGK